MRLLLTRATREAARTRAVLEAAGHKVLLSPVLQVAATGKPLPRQPPDAVIATSARAFVHVAAPDWDPAPLPLALVGARTEVAARAAGFMGPAKVAATGAALAAALRAHAPRGLLYLAGADRKRDLEAALAGGPHRLVVVETYAARPASSLTGEAERALREGRIDAVLHYSRRSAAIFLRLSDAAGLDARASAHFCLSPDVAAAFPDCIRVRVAAAPDEAALLALADSL